MVSSEWWKQFMIQNVHWILYHLTERTKPCDSIIRPSVDYMMTLPTVIKFWEVFIFIHLNLAIGRIFLRRNLTGTCSWRKGDHFSFYRWRDTLGRRDGKIEHTASKRTAHSENGRCCAWEWPVHGGARVPRGPEDGKGGWARFSCSCCTLWWSFWLGSVSSGALHSFLITGSTWDSSEHHLGSH